MEIASASVRQQNVSTVWRSLIANIGGCLCGKLDLMLQLRAFVYMLVERESPDRNSRDDWTARFGRDEVR
jgi:hypothetical protein